MLQSLFSQVSPLLILMAEAQSEGAPAQPAQILGQNLEDLIMPYIAYITFGIDVSQE